MHSLRKRWPTMPSQRGAWRGVPRVTLKDGSVHVVEYMHQSNPSKNKFSRYSETCCHIGFYGRVTFIGPPPNCETRMLRWVQELEAE